MARALSGHLQNGVRNPFCAIGSATGPVHSLIIMAVAASINPRIIEGLYCEALVLSDEVRSAFAPLAQADHAVEDEARIALSCEALRTTTRMMHAVAWLLNHRAYFNGELTEFQLRRHGKLVDYPEGEPQRLAMLDPEIRALVRATERFHARLKRIDSGWRERDLAAPGPVASLHNRLGMQHPPG